MADSAKPYIVKIDLAEENLDIALETKGEIPTWLQGVLVRNGPINFSINGHPNRHWFDGLAMLHAFSFDRGKVSYNNRFLKTDAYRSVFNKGSLNYDGFLTDPCRSLFNRFFTYFFPSFNHAMPNANINVTKIADAYIAMLEIPLPVRFDLNTLETLGVLEFQDRLPQSGSWESAHPHLNTNSQEMVNYLIDYGMKSHYIVYRIKNGSRERETISKIPVSQPSYMHTFALTENYIILAEYPFVVNPLDFILKGTFIENFKWKPEIGTQLLVIDKKSGGIVEKCKTKAFFAFHHVNAYEKEGKIILDIVTYKDASIVMGLGNYFRENSTISKSAENNGPFASQLERFTIHLHTSNITSNVILNRPLEFPRINPNYDGKLYRHVYLTDARDEQNAEDICPLLKFNVESGQVNEWSEAGCYPGEPVFIPKPNAEQEDDGVITAVVFDRKNESSFLLILDAITFTEKARGVAPYAIPPGLHGQFFSN